MLPINNKTPKVENRVRFPWMVLISLLLWGVPGPEVLAQEDEEESTSDATADEADKNDGVQASLGLEPSPIDLLFPKVRTKRFSLALDVDRWTPKDEVLQAIYPDAAWRAGLELGFFVNRQLNPTISAGVARLQGNSVGLVTQEISTGEATMYVAPLKLSLLYRFDYSWDQVIQPYVGLGGDAWAYRESSPDAITSGIKWGVHGTAGMLFRLNFMEITSGWAPVYGVYPTDAGLSAAVTYAWVDSFSAPGIDFSGLQFTIGGYLAF